MDQDTTRGREGDQGYSGEPTLKKTNCSVVKYMHLTNASSLVRFRLGFFFLSTAHMTANPQCSFCNPYGIVVSMRNWCHAPPSTSLYRYTCICTCQCVVQSTSLKTVMPRLPP